MDTLWDNLHDLFDTDDGGLAEIWIANLSADGVSNIYLLIRCLAATLPRDAVSWDTPRDQATLLTSVPNAARLVAEQRAEPFHFIAQGIALGNAPLPSIGVFVFPDQLVLDYRTGDDWDATVLHTLFELFKQIKYVEPAAHITLEDAVIPAVRQRFARAVDNYLTASET